MEWRGETSSDEMTGHFFAYSIYYQLCADDAEKAAIRETVRKIMDHILDNDFHPIEAETRNKLLADKKGGDSDLVPSKPIKIGKNCFIGCNAIILKGTELGDGCVVGAGAVVSGKFEAGSVIVGNPGRVIRKLGDS